MKPSKSFNLLPKTPGTNFLDFSGTSRTPALSIKELKKDKKVQYHKIIIIGCLRV